ncbi:MAG: alpha/beta hydrolase [Acetobacter sp.]|uniref:alpha/beta fold hydrolase n=1 Tax=Acetobacter sp. TaxID=440 RepID=UPI0039EB1B55
MQGLRAVFLHGWGFGPDIWTPVISRLGWDGVQTPDLGFLGTTGASVDEVFERIGQEGRPVLAVGHSLGFLWLASQQGWPAGSIMVGVNAFGCFAARPDFAQGVSARILARMIKGLETDAAGVVNTFRARCGAPAVPEGCCVNVAPLRAGLDMLMQADVRTPLAGMAGRICILGGTEDAVVPPAMLAASVPGGVTTRWVEGGHMLPWTNPEACARLLRDVAASGAGQPDL